MEREELKLVTTVELVNDIRSSVEHLLSLKNQTSLPTYDTMSQQSLLSLPQSSHKHSEPSMTLSQSNIEIEKQLVKYEADIRKHISLEH